MKYNTKKRKQERLKWQILIGLAVIAAIVVKVHWNMVGTEIALAQNYDQITIPETQREITDPTKEQVKDEIIRQSQLFGVDTRLALDLAECESGFNYKAKNSKSTARGVYQYLIGTWEATESAKQGKERNDYKANIREAMIDLANGEFDKWKDCYKKVK